MDTLDLDINNYNLDELLCLFKLDYHFTEVDLKNARKISLKTHPDKSGLDVKYFLFFQKAYESLSKIFYFRSRRHNSTDYDDYEAKEDKNNARLLHKLDGKSIKEFNIWFNEMFEKVKISDEETDAGYEEWYKSQEKVDNRKIPMNEFGAAFEKKKRECKSLVVQRGVSNIEKNDGYSLTREKPSTYSSSIFSKLQYEDLKKAHTESVVPVTSEDFDRKAKFSDVDSFIRHRDVQDTTPLSLEQSRQYLSERENKNTQSSMQRAFSMVKRDIEVEKCNEKWWSNLRLLGNQ
jgi:hypothetical protein